MGEAREPQEAEYIHIIMTVVQQNPTQYVKQLKRNSISTESFFLTLNIYEYSRKMSIIQSILNFITKNKEPQELSIFVIKYVSIYVHWKD